MIGIIVFGIGVGKAAWRWLMPHTIIRMDGYTFIVYTDIDTFEKRWLEAMQKKTLLPLSPRLYLNPIQIMYCHGRRR